MSKKEVILHRGKSFEALKDSQDPAEQSAYYAYRLFQLRGCELCALCNTVQDTCGMIGIGYINLPNDKTRMYGYVLCDDCAARVRSGEDVSEEIGTSLDALCEKNKMRGDIPLATDIADVKSFIDQLWQSGK